MGLLGIFLCFRFPSSVFGVLLLNVALIQVLFFLSTIAHELGHILLAGIAGLRPFGVEIGKGPVVVVKKWFGLRWEFRAIPYGGCAHSATPRTRFYRLRQTVCVLGGPLANAVLLGFGVCGIYAGLDQFKAGELLAGLRPAGMFTAVNVALLFFSIWPAVYDTRYGKSPSDGLLLWQTWRLAPQEIEGHVAHYFYKECESSHAEGRFPDALRWAQDGLKRHPRSYELAMMEAAILIELSRLAESRRAYIRLLGRYYMFPEVRSLIFNNVADGDLLTSDPELLAEADACSRLAMELTPSAYYVKGTRGGALVEMGEYEEGLPLLHEALSQTPDKRDKALDACYIGIAEEQRGRRAESRSYFALARRLDPKCLLLAREPKEAS
jgi:tetratricopeptide (TPR) repeat protein